MDTPRPIRPAATVIVTAPLGGTENGKDNAYAVFTVKRSHGSGFMAGAHVFPGGIVDEVDHLKWWDGDTNAEAVDDLPYRIAAIRELFEETGILLVTPPEAGDALSDDELQHLREAVHSDANEFPRLCAKLDCAPAIERMLPWSRWITPPQEKRRFDARFYVATLDHQPKARHDDHETISSCWIQPDEALAAAERGEIFLPPPTWFTFRELRANPTQKQLRLEAQSGRSLDPIEPHILSGDGELILVMQGDEEHPINTGNNGERNRIVLKDGRYTFSCTQADRKER